MTTPNSKICNSCKIDKPLTDFNLDKKCKYGRNSRCRACIANQLKIRNATPPEVLLQKRIDKENDIFLRQCNARIYTKDFNEDTVKDRTYKDKVKPHINKEQVMVTYNGKGKVIKEQNVGNYYDRTANIMGYGRNIKKANEDNDDIEPIVDPSKLE